MDKHPYDNSQIVSYSSCPMKYYLKFIRRLAKSDQTDLSTIHLDFGSCYHSFMKDYYLRYKEKSSRPIDLAHIWSTFNDREGEDTKTNHNGKLLCRAYIAQYKDIDSFEVIEVEKPIEVDIGGHRFIVIRDGVIKTNNNILSFEHKTTGRLDNFYFTRYFINSQITAQTFVTLEEYGECSGVLLNVAQPKYVKKPILLLPDDKEIELYENHDVKYCKYYKADRAYCSGFTAKFERDIISRNKEEMEDWKQNVVYWIDRIEESKETNKWPKADSGYNCGRCEFKELCKTSVETDLSDEIVDVLYSEIDPLSYLGLG